MRSARLLLSLGAAGCVHHWRPTGLDWIAARAARGDVVEVEVETTDHDTYRGILVTLDDTALTLATPRGPVTLPRADLAGVEVWRGDPGATALVVLGGAVAAGGVAGAVSLKGADFATGN